MTNDYLWDPTQSVPDSEIQKLEESLSTFAYRPKTLKLKRRSLISFPTGLAFAASFLIIFTVLWFSAPLKDERSLTVRLQSGSFQCGSDSLNDSQRIGQLRAQQWLDTENGEALLDWQDNGVLIIGPESKVRWVPSEQSLTRLELKSGQVSSNKLTRQGHFSIVTPNGTVEDLGAEFSVRVDDEETILQVSAGAVFLKKDGEQSYVPKGASCRSHRESGLGYPVFRFARRRFKKELASYKNIANGDPQEILRLSKYSRPQDTLTLWHVFIRSKNPAQKELLLQEIDRHIRIPNTLDPEQLIRGDPSSLKSWKTYLSNFWHDRGRMKKG